MLTICVQTFHLLFKNSLFDEFRPPVQINMLIIITEPSELVKKVYLYLTVCQRLSFTFFHFFITPTPQKKITHTQRGRRAVSARAGLMYIFLKIYCALQQFHIARALHIYDCNNFEVATRAARLVGATAKRQDKYENS